MHTESKTEKKLNELSRQKIWNPQRKKNLLVINRIITKLDMCIKKNGRNSMHAKKKNIMPANMKYSWNKNVILLKKKKDLINPCANIISYVHKNIEQTKYIHTTIRYKSKNEKKMFVNLWRSNNCAEKKIGRRLIVPPSPSSLPVAILENT